MEPWTPSPYTVFKIIMSARLCAAAWNIVGDCDETYNYWEPVCKFESKHDKTNKMTCALSRHRSDENSGCCGNLIGL